MPVVFTFTFAVAAAVEDDDEEEEEEDEEDEEEEEDDVSLVVDADTPAPFPTTTPSALPAPALTPAAALQGTLACMYKAGFEVYDINPHRAMDVSQRSRTCLDFMMSCGSATSMTAENASRSLLKSEAAGRERSVLEAAAAVVVVAGRTELKTFLVARVAVSGTATADSDDVITIDSSDVEVSADDVTATSAATATGAGEGALYLQNPAAFALVERMFLSCFSV